LTFHGGDIILEGEGENMVFGLIFVPTLDKEERNQSKKSLKKTDLSAEY
jgi:hypothetical protein